MPNEIIMECTHISERLYSMLPPMKVGNRYRFHRFTAIDMHGECNYVALIDGIDDGVRSHRFYLHYNEKTKVIKMPYVINNMDEIIVLNPLPDKLQFHYKMTGRLPND